MLDDDVDSQEARDQSSSMSRSESTIEDPVVENRKDSPRDYYEVEERPHYNARHGGYMQEQR